jgi:uncharacterized membrane protein
MIKTEVYKHYIQSELDKHIENKIKDGYTLISCSTVDTFWSLSLYTKQSTLVWKK